MSSSETSAIPLHNNGLPYPNFDGYFNDKEVPQFDGKNPYPYSYASYLPQTESEVKSAVEDLTQKLQIEGMARRQSTIQS
jgi:hypothetical protein